MNQPFLAVMIISITHFCRLSCHNRKKEVIEFLSRPLSSPYHIHAVKIFVKLLEYQILKYFALHFVIKCLLEKRCAYKYFFIYTIPLNISFRRCLVGNNLNLWYKLIASVAHIRLNDVEDNFIWGLLQNGDFSVSSMYRALILDN
jgi:hypothetical protein